MYARMISKQTDRYNQLLDARKKQLLSHIVDDPSVKDVLEVGAGSGANLPYYASRKVCHTCASTVGVFAQQCSFPHIVSVINTPPQDIHLSAVDPNPEMLQYLQAT